MNNTPKNLGFILENNVENNVFRIDESRTLPPGVLALLTGTFIPMDEPGENGRWYTYADYAPHVEMLQPKIKSLECFGEEEHPKRVNTLFSLATHRVEEVYYDPQSNSWVGTIALLDTDMGRKMYDIVKTGAPLYVSHRALGSVDQKTGKGIILKLLGWDITSNPSFKKAQFQNATTINESLFMIGIEDQFLNEAYEVLGIKDESFINEMITLSKSDLLNMLNETSDNARKEVALLVAKGIKFIDEAIAVDANDVVDAVKANGRGYITAQEMVDPGFQFDGQFLHPIDLQLAMRACAMEGILYDSQAPGFQEVDPQPSSLLTVPQIDQFVAGETSVIGDELAQPEFMPYGQGFANESIETFDSVQSLVNFTKFIELKLEVFHHNTRSYAQHKAFDKIYNSFGDLTDSIIEQTIGYTGVRYEAIELPKIEYTDKTGVELVNDIHTYARALTDYSQKNGYSSLDNLADEIDGMAAQLAYLLTLNESKVTDWLKSKYHKIKSWLNSSETGEVTIDGITYDIQKVQEDDCVFCVDSEGNEKTFSFDVVYKYINENSKEYNNMINENNDVVNNILSILKEAKFVSSTESSDYDFTLNDDGITAVNEEVAEDIVAALKGKGITVSPDGAKINIALPMINEATKSELDGVDNDLANRIRKSMQAMNDVYEKGIRTRDSNKEKAFYKKAYLHFKDMNKAREEAGLKYWTMPNLQKEADKNGWTNEATDEKEQEEINEALKLFELNESANECDEAKRIDEASSDVQKFKELPKDIQNKITDAQKGMNAFYEKAIRKGNNADHKKAFSYFVEFNKLRTENGLSYFTMPNLQKIADSYGWKNESGDLDEGAIFDDILNEDANLDDESKRCDESAADIVVGTKIKTKQGTIVVTDLKKDYVKGYLLERFEKTGKKNEVTFHYDTLDNPHYSDGIVIINESEDVEDLDEASASDIKKLYGVNGFDTGNISVSNYGGVPAVIFKKGVDNMTLASKIAKKFGRSFGLKHDTGITIHPLDSLAKMDGVTGDTVKFYNNLTINESEESEDKKDKDMINESTELEIESRKLYVDFCKKQLADIKDNGDARIVEMATKALEKAEADLKEEEAKFINESANLEIDARQKYVDFCKDNLASAKETGDERKIAAAEYSLKGAELELQKTKDSFVNESEDAEDKDKEKEDLNESGDAEDKDKEKEDLNESGDAEDKDKEKEDLNESGPIGLAVGATFVLKTVNYTVAENDGTTIKTTDGHEFSVAEVTAGEDVPAPEDTTPGTPAPTINESEDDEDDDDKKRIDESDEDFAERMKKAKEDKEKDKDLNESGDADDDDKKRIDESDEDFAERMKKAKEDKEKDKDLNESGDAEDKEKGDDLDESTLENIETDVINTGNETEIPSDLEKPYENQLADQFAAREDKSVVFEDWISKKAETDDKINHLVVLTTKTIIQNNEVLEVINESAKLTAEFLNESKLEDQQSDYLKLMKANMPKSHEYLFNNLNESALGILDAQAKMYDLNESNIKSFIDSRNWAEIAQGNLNESVNLVNQMRSNNMHSALMQSIKAGRL